MLFVDWGDNVIVLQETFMSQALKVPGSISSTTINQRELCSAFVVVSVCLFLFKRSFSSRITGLNLYFVVFCFVFYFLSPAFLLTAALLFLKLPIERRSILMVISFHFCIYTIIN